MFEVGTMVTKAVYSPAIEQEVLTTFDKHKHRHFGNMMNTEAQ